MKGRVIWRVIAQADLAEAHAYLGVDSPEVAERLVDAVDTALNFLLENPYAGSPKPRGGPSAQDVRTWSPRGFPNHLIFYRPMGDDIEVLRFLHGARDLRRYLDEGPWTAREAPPSNSWREPAFARSA